MKEAPLRNVTQLIERGLAPVAVGLIFAGALAVIRAANVGLLEIATIAIGYADGYDRRFSNGVGEVLIKGQRAPIIGNVCMDMCMVNVTGLDVSEGDEVLVFGKELPITELAGRPLSRDFDMETGLALWKNALLLERE